MSSKIFKIVYGSEASVVKLRIMTTVWMLDKKVQDLDLKKLREYNEIGTNSNPVGSFDKPS
jgi:hypothetical protein